VGMKKYHFWKYLFYSVLISCIVKAVYISLWYLWWISLARLKLIQEWRSELALFLIIWVVLLIYIIKNIFREMKKIYLIILY
jgi:membrane protein DedA with SNARE-associated domain